MGVITDFQICIGLLSTPHIVIPKSWLYSSLSHHPDPIAPICHQGVRSCREGETLNCLGMQRVQGHSSRKVIGKERIKITFDIPLLRNMLHIKAKAAACHGEHFTESSPKAAVRSPLP